MDKVLTKEQAERQIRELKAHIEALEMDSVEGVLVAHGDKVKIGGGTYDIIYVGNHLYCPIDLRDGSRWTDAIEYRDKGNGVPLKLFKGSDKSIKVRKL